MKNRVAEQPHNTNKTYFILFLHVWCLINFKYSMFFALTLEELIAQKASSESKELLISRLRFSFSNLPKFKFKMIQAVWSPAVICKIGGIRLVITFASCLPVSIQILSSMKIHFKHKNFNLPFFN